MLENNMHLRNFRIRITSHLSNQKQQRKTMNR